MIRLEHFLVALDNTRVAQGEGYCWRVFICTGNHLYGEQQHYTSKEAAWEEVKHYLNGQLHISFVKMQLWVPKAELGYLGTLSFFNSEGPVALTSSESADPGFMFTPTVKVENSGEHCEYYHCEVADPQNPNQPVGYIANCEDIIQALGLTFDEGCEFKSIWRRGRGRQGFVKAESTPVRDATKAVHYAQRVLAYEQRKAGEK